MRRALKFYSDLRHILTAIVATVRVGPQTFYCVSKNSYLELELRAKIFADFNDLSNLHQLKKNNLQSKSALNQHLS